MQLLPCTKDCPTLIDEFKERIRRLVKEIEPKALEIAHSITQALYDDVDAEHTLYLTYAGSMSAEAAATLSYNILRQLTELPVRLEPVETLVYHTLAYRGEKAIILLFVEPGAESMAGRASDATRVTGNKIVVITPPIPSTLVYRIGEQNVFEVDTKELDLTYIILAARIAAEISEKHSSVKIRKERILRETESLTEVVDELEDKYKSVTCNLAKLVAAKNCLAIGYTPTMLPPAKIYYKLRLYNLKHTTIIGPVSALLTLASRFKQNKLNVLVFSTDAEQDAIRELSFRMRVSIGATLVELRMHTDPLTAPIYASILVKTVEKIMGVKE